MKRTFRFLYLDNYSHKDREILMDKNRKEKVRGFCPGLKTKHSITGNDPFHPLSLSLAHLKV